MRTSLNSYPIVGFVRFPWMRNQNCPPPLSQHLDVFVLTDYHSVSALGQRSSNALCPRYLRVREGHCQMEDVLIHGLDQSEDDGRVRAVLHCLQEVGLTLNDKCEFSQSSIRFLAHIIDSSGLQADPQKTTAVTQFPVPSVSPGYSDSWGPVSLQRVWIHSKK